MPDFLAALQEIEPSAIREVFSEVPSVRWEDVGGLEEVKELLHEAVVWPLRHPDLFRRLGVRPPRGVLLHGPPGTGKTLLAKAVAHESGVNLIAIKGPALLSRYVGESERAVREVFRKARQVSPCLLFFDEFDSLAPARGRLGGEGGVAERVMGQILAEMDGVEDLPGVVVLAATNRPDLIDPALLRPGRFDLKVEVPLPPRAGRLAIIRIHTRGMPLDADVSLGILADATAGLSGAETAAVCQRAAMAAIREIMGAWGAQARPGGGAGLRAAPARPGLPGADAAAPGAAKLPADPGDAEWLGSVAVAWRHFEAALREVGVPGMSAALSGTAAVGAAGAGRTAGADAL
jgi:transitional endoplasmic reticulum ATPase